MAVEAASIPDLHTSWVRSTMTEAKIHALLDRGLLWLNAKVVWRATAGQRFLSEDVNE
jgi:hypothetical protein